MIQNMLFTSLAPLNDKNEVTCWENRPFLTVWPENNRQKIREVTKTIKKKQKRVRTAFSSDQLRALEKEFSRRRYINSEKRAELANALKIGDNCIKFWFQNRRMKEKRQSLESSSDSSNKSVACCKNRPFLTVSPENNQQKIRDVTRTINKKQKRVRTAFSSDQLRALEKEFSRRRYIHSEKRAELANALKIGEKCVKVWFRNRRMKEKRKSSDAPPLQVIIDQKNTEHLNQFTYYPVPIYYLPTYYNANPVQSGYGGMAPPGKPGFHYKNML